MIISRISPGICLLLIVLLVSHVSEAVEKTVFPKEIYVQSNYEGLIKVVENFAKDKAVTHVQTGDLNGDGLGDAIIGSRHSDANGLVDAGIIYILFGNQDIFLTSPLDVRAAQNILKITGNEANDYLGRSLSTGDINGDGIDDLLFGASNCLINNEPYQGNAYVLFGSPDLSTWDTIDLRNPASDVIVITGDYEIGLGASLGDINGDGFSDIILGAPTSNDTGVSYVIKGSSDFEDIGFMDLAVDSPDIIRIQGENASDYFGAEAASGDINGDGFDEVIIGARHADKDLKESCGKTYILWGYTDFFLQESIDINALSQNLTVICGAEEHNFSGTEIATGNLNGDTCDELILESSRYDPGDRPYAGCVYILKGSRQIADMVELDLGGSYPDLIKIYGEDENDLLGRGIISDIDGDQIDDIILASQGENETGETYVLTDETLWSQNEIDLSQLSAEITIIYGNQQSGITGYELGACDLNGDGINDLILTTADLPWASYFSDGIAYIMSGAGVTAVPNQSYEVFAVDTGNSSTIVILDEHTPLLDGFPLEHGAEIGVFTPSGICAGVGIWDGNDLRITVWGDNPDTNDIEGFEEGERYCFHTQNEYQGEYTECSVSILSGDTEYAADDIVVISSLQFGVIVDVAEAAPISFSLDQNYPNPFNPVTTIPFTIPDAGHVELSVFDIRGARIGTLVDTVLSPGRHTAEWNAMAYPSGVYLYRLKTGTAVQSGKMLLIK